MDTLKLDRFKRLLNRQYTSISLGESTSTATPAPTSLPAVPAARSSQSKLARTPSNGIDDCDETAVVESIRHIVTNIPDYITKDNPKPAIFIARKFLSDFLEIVSDKIETILEQKDLQIQQHQQQQQQQHQQPPPPATSSSTRSRPLFRTFQRTEDIIYDQILDALGSTSEHCLPSILNLLLSWYYHQLDYDEAPCNLSLANSSLSQAKRPQSSLDDSYQQSQNQANNVNNHHHHHHQRSQSECCSSPCNNEAYSLPTTSSIISSDSTAPITIRSPTPTDQEASNNRVSIVSSSPLEIQSPMSLTAVIQNSSSDMNQSPSNAANTSNSTTDASSNSFPNEDSTVTSRRQALLKTRKLLIEYAFCQALIELFGKLSLHPGHEDLIKQIENIAFEHFKVVDLHDNHGVDINDVHKLAQKFAEVIGVLAQTRFKMVEKRFFEALNELRAREPTPYNIQCIVTLLSHMKFIRVKMAPIEEFETSMRYLQKCADYFVEVRHKSVKHALAETFVEIMLPLAATVKNEVKIPCLKNFVDTLWTPALDMCTKKKHSITMFPLVTCLLCVSQRSTFLQNWGSFLNMCLSNLKNRDQKMCRVAFESLYRLIWIYMIRVKCESNNVTQARLQTIVDALFPRGSRQIVPRDAQLSIFVDIILFIATERLDFVMRHIILELLSVERPTKVITAPERMNIAIQAFLVIVENLQQKETESSMPLAIGSASANFLSSLNQVNQSNCTGGNDNGARKGHSNRMLNDDLAKSIGIYPYYNHIQKSFNEVLKALDTQVGKPLMLNTNQNLSRDLENIITSDRKPKLDLLKTCIAAIPRLIPDGMSKSDLIGLLARMTIHVDEEVRRSAFESLHYLVIHFQDWRLDAIEGYTLFLAEQLGESSSKSLIDGALRTLLQLLISWHNLITSGFSGDNSHKSSSVTIQTGYETISSRNSGTGGQIAARKNRALAEMRLIQSELSSTRFDRLINVIQKVEGASLALLCSCHHTTRKLANHLLRESRAIVKCYSSWTCMEQYGLKSTNEPEDDDISVSLKGSLSADNLSRITTTSFNGPVYNSVTSMNTQPILSTSVSKMCISSASNQQSSIGQPQMHDLYDEDIEKNLADCYSSEDNPALLFWIAVMILESERDFEYSFALRLLRKILPILPFEQQGFLDELERNLKQMEWDNFLGIHGLVLRGCASESTYDLCITLLDHLTPLLKHRICTGPSSKPEDCLPFHILILSTHLLSNYEDPSPFSLNVARRLSLCCEENSQKLENLSAVMTLYSRRSFSKDAFQWIKCVAKYIFDASPNLMPSVISLFVDLLETGPEQVQRLTAPILYCLLTYADLNNQSFLDHINDDLMKIYSKCLGNVILYRDAIQIFKLIVSKSSSLSEKTGRSYTGELPGRTMEFTIDIELLPVIGKTKLTELQALPAQQQPCLLSGCQGQSIGGSNGNISASANSSNLNPNSTSNPVTSSNTNVSCVGAPPEPENQPGSTTAAPFSKQQNQLLNLTC